MIPVESAHSWEGTGPDKEQPEITWSGYSQSRPPEAGRKGNILLEITHTPGS